MFMQNPVNPCQLLQQQNDGSWKVIFDFSKCTGNLPSTTSGDRRCNIASLMTDTLLPDGVDAILNARSVAPNITNFSSVILGIAASLATGGLAVTLLGGSGISVFVNLIWNINITNTRAEIDSEYWLDVKRQIYCTLRDDSVLSPQVLEALATAVENIPNKPNANTAVGETLRNLSSAVSERVTQISAYPYGSSEGCDDCPPLAQLISVYSSAQAIDLGGGHWKLIANSAPSYLAQFRLPFINQCCRLKIDDVVIAPSFPDEQPQAGIVRCGESNQDFLDDYMSLDDQCFSSFTIYSTGPFEIDVTVTEDICSDLSAYQLYTEIVEGYLQTLTADPNGDYVLYSLDNLPNPDINGYRRYFLGKPDYCFKVQLEHFPGGLYGQFPEKVCVYDCDGNETEYTDSNDINRFFAGEICFNSFALAPADNSFYLLKVRVSACPLEWCYKWDFTAGDGGWYASKPNSSYSAALGAYSAGIGWTATSTTDSAGTKTRGISLQVAASTHITQVDVTYTITHGTFNFGGPGPRTLSRDGTATGRGTDFYSNASGTNGTNLVFSWTGDQDITALNLLLQTSIRNDAGAADGSATVTKIRLQGTGTNPFGSDNCS